MEAAAASVPATLGTSSSIVRGDPVAVLDRRSSELVLSAGCAVLVVPPPGRAEV